MTPGSKQLNIASSHCRYKKLLSSVDLTKDFFFSYTYPIMQSLQKNVLSNQEGGMPYDNIFVWNAYLTQAIRSRCNNTIWTIALVHGHFRQVCTCLLSSACLLMMVIQSVYSICKILTIEVRGRNIVWTLLLLGIRIFGMELSSNWVQYSWLLGGGVIIG